MFYKWWGHLTHLFWVSPGSAHIRTLLLSSSLWAYCRGNTAWRALCTNEDRVSLQVGWWTQSDNCNGTSVCLPVWWYLCLFTCVQNSSTGWWVLCFLVCRSVRKQLWHTWMFTHFMQRYLKTHTRMHTHTRTHIHNWRTCVYWLHLKEALCWMMAHLSPVMGKVLQVWQRTLWLTLRLTDRRYRVGSHSNRCGSLCSHDNTCCSPAVGVNTCRHAESVCRHDEH